MPFDVWVNVTIVVTIVAYISTSEYLRRRD